MNIRPEKPQDLDLDPAISDWVDSFAGTEGSFTPVIYPFADILAREILL